MHILKAGDVDTPRHFQTGCAGCGCEFQFATNEPGVVLERNFPHYTVALTCPGCSQRQQRTVPMPGLVELTPRQVPAAAKLRSMSQAEIDELARRTMLDRQAAAGSATRNDAMRLTSATQRNDPEFLDELARRTAPGGA